MLTQFYTTEEDATLCSMIWGTNFTLAATTATTTTAAASRAIPTTSSIINYYNNSNIIYKNVVVITNDNGLIASSAALNGNVNGDYINAAAAAAAAAAATVSADKSITGDRNTIINSVSVGDNLRDDLYIIDEDPRTETLREYSYGVILPIICSLGIIGNMLNLIVLTRRNMRGTAYIYMRAYSTAALLAIVFAIPFGIRMLVHKDRGQWQEFGPAFYTAHLELFLGNGCLGVGVMMLLILTIERYVSVCHPSFTRPVMGPPGLIVFLTTILTFIIYVPSVFRGELIKCTLQNHTYQNSIEYNNNGNNFVYFRRDNKLFQKTIFYSIYKVMLEVIFKLIPTVLIAGLNLRIMIVYRQTCEKRRKMILTRSTYIKDDDPRKFAEERRLFLLLGSTSILFLVCVSPMAILHMTIASEVLPIFSFQVFRASANLLELTNYSMTFYIYCLFSEDFRNTLIRTIKWPWIKSQLFQQVNEVTAKQIPLTNFDKLTLRNHHITTTSGVCTGIGRSSSI